MLDYSERVTNENEEIRVNPIFSKLHPLEHMT